MVARHASKFPKRKFNESWIVVARVKANSRLSEKRKTDANFCPAFLKAERSGRRSQFLFGTKMLDPKITAKSRANFDRRTPIILTKPNTESETGRAAVARLRVKQSVASRRVRSQEKHCPPYTRTSNSWLT